jgi:succinyl-CoA synthetase alpha subunit
MAGLGLGQSTCVGIGGDPVPGIDFVTCLRAFEADPDTDVVVMIGEIGGPQEVEAARYAAAHMTKPVIGFVAGASAPRGRRMGHAGAIVSGESDTATAKMDVMEELGLYVVRNPAGIGKTVAKALRDTGASLTRVAAS